ncbi:hydrogenase maturation nickel metallochaperone HypA [Thermopolyspora sp. NPDC052614]|uniref:hydrogenase maturation nickel metallochaperone HypA/HybF n=1 Tax=Thermopolyspora sp. NPDC052614 TaxID=3155682 RepID=UPI00341BE5B3
MHEIGLCEGLLDLVGRQAEGRRVTGVKVRIGARHAVLDEAFGQAFAIVAGGTAAEGARLDLVVSPVTVLCRGCGRVSDSHDVLSECPGCGGDDIELRGGDELVLESITFEEESPCASASPAG